MRTVADRIRHAVSFELIGFLIVVSTGILLFDMPLQSIGVVAIVGSVIATLWVYAFNYLFDLALLRRQGHARSSVRQRIANSVLFEIGLLLVLLPFIAWYLQVSLLDALNLGASLSVFYLVYSFGFNWVYDLVFPMEPQPAHD